MTDDPETQPLSKYLSKKEKLLIITALSGEFPYNRSRKSILKNGESMV